jgi:uncharacterized membrane protein
MQLTPIVAVHLTCVSLATGIGPVALWARLGAMQRPRLHRAFGYAWVTLMIVAALSAIFIHDTSIPNIAGYTPIHLLIPFVLFNFYSAFRALAQGRIARHRRFMQGTYFGACVGAGLFTLIPGRYLGICSGTACLASRKTSQIEVRF